MADQGGTRAPRGQSRLSRLTQAVALTASLNSQQLQDQRARQSDESVQLDDSNRLDTTQRSPLQLPAKSYTQEDESETGFGEQVSTLAEMEEQRTRETKMRETAEQFVGIPSEGAAPAPGRPASPRRTTEESEPDIEETEEGPEQGAEEQEASEQAQSSILRNLMEGQARANLERRQQLANATQEAAVQDKEGARKQLQQTWRFVSGTELMFAETIVPLIFMMFTLNIQLANKVSFRNFDMVPDLSAPEAAGVIFFDCGCCFNCLINFIMIVIPLVPLVILMVIALKAVDSIGGVLGFLFK